MCKHIYSNAFALQRIQLSVFAGGFTTLTVKGLFCQVKSSSNWWAEKSNGGFLTSPTVVNTSVDRSSHWELDVTAGKWGKNDKNAIGYTNLMLLCLENKIYWAKNLNLRGMFSKSISTVSSWYTAKSPEWQSHEYCQHPAPSPNRYSAVYDYFPNLESFVCVAHRCRINISDDRQTQKMVNRCVPKK